MHPYPDDGAAPRGKPEPLASLDIDAQRSPSFEAASADGWALAVRGWGMLVITTEGIKLLWRKDLGSETIDGWGPLFP